MHILLTSNTAWSIFNFRRKLIESLQDEGHQVTLVSPRDEWVEKLSRYQCNFVDIRINNKGLNPLQDILTAIRYFLLFRALKPDVVMTFTVKPVVYGSIAAHILKIPVLCTMTGLGTAFVEGGWMKRLVSLLYKVSLPKSKIVFTHNHDDSALLISERIVDKKKIQCVGGSGIDLDRFTPAPYPPEPPIVVLMISRLIRDKGVIEFFEAARKIVLRFPGVRFKIAGPIIQINRTALTNSEVEELGSEGVVEFLGQVDDVRDLISRAHCVVLPSYREGMPRVLLEAAAMARPVITTDVPGCREALSPKKSGYLCKVKDSDDLARVLEEFILLQPELKKDMGKAGREYVKRKFSDQSVVQHYITAVANIKTRSA